MFGFNPFSVTDISKKSYRLVQLQTMINLMGNFYNECELFSLELDIKIKRDYGTRRTQAKYAWYMENDFSKYKKLLSDINPENSLVNSFNWYKAYNKNFLESDYWMDYKKSHAQLQPKLELLEISWKLHGRFSHYTSPNLLIAANALSKLDKTVLKAFSELKKTKKHFKSNNYEKYLTDVRKQVSIEKLKLAEAMFARVNLAIKSHDLTNHDVTTDLVNQLQNLQILPPEEIKTKRPPTKFDSSIYTGFYNYIINTGDEHLKSKLDELLSIKDGGKIIGIQLSNSSKNCIFVPEHLREFIPRKPRKPTWLFKGHQIRYDFFQNEEVAELLLRLASNSHVSMEQLSRQQLTDLQASLAQARVKANTLMPTGWGSSVRKYTYQFLASWQTLLQQQEILILEQQIAYVESAVRNIITPMEHLDNVPAETLNDVRTLITHIEMQISTLPSSQEEMQLRLKRVKEHPVMVNEIKFREQQKNQRNIIDILQGVIKTQVCTASEFSALVTNWNNLLLNQKKAFMEKNDLLIQGLLKPFLEFLSLKADILQESIDINQIGYIAKCGKILRIIASIEIGLQLDKTIDDFLNYYMTKLQALTTLSASERNKLEIFEETVGQLASNSNHHFMMAQARLLRKNLPENSQQKIDLESSLHSADIVAIEENIKRDSQEVSREVLEFHEAISNLRHNTAKLEESIQGLTNRKEVSISRNPHSTFSRNLNTSSQTKELQSDNAPSQPIKKS